MDLPLGQPSGGAVFPRKDIFFSAQPAEDRLLAEDRTLTLPAVVTAVSVQLYSLLDCSDRLQEPSRKQVLLQATYLPRRKTAITHRFTPFCCFGYCTSAVAVRQVFSVRGRISFSHADSKNRELSRKSYFFKEFLINFVVPYLINSNIVFHNFVDQLFAVHQVN